MRSITLVLLSCILMILTGCSTGQETASDEPSQTANASSLEELEMPENQSKVETKPVSDSPSAEEGIIPAKLSIPAINVKGNVIKAGTLPNGQMASPETKDDIGWYKEGAKPGEKGSAVLAAHVDSATGPAVFFHLEDVKENDLIHVTSEKGEKLTFKVYETKSYPRNSAPISKIFGYTAAKTLKLITCTGEFLDDAGTHEIDWLFLLIS